MEAELKEKVEEARAKRLEQSMELYRGGLARAYAGTASPRGAIKAFCLECVGQVRKEVANCTSFACPLWGYRPYQEGAANAPGDESSDPESTNAEECVG